MLESLDKIASTGMCCGMASFTFILSRWAELQWGSFRSHLSGLGKHRCSYQTLKRLRQTRYVAFWFLGRHIVTPQLACQPSRSGPRGSKIKPCLPLGVLQALCHTIIPLPCWISISDSKTFKINSLACRLGFGRHPITLLLPRHRKSTRRNVEALAKISALFLVDACDRSLCTGTWRNVKPRGMVGKSRCSRNIRTMAPRRHRVWTNGSNMTLVWYWYISRVRHIARYGMSRILGSPKGKIIRLLSVHSFLGNTFWPQNHRCVGKHYDLVATLQKKALGWTSTQEATVRGSSKSR